MSLLLKVFSLRLQDCVALCPIAVWLPRLLRESPVQSLVKDFFCGITVAAVVIPQGMAYGMLALLPPVYGLYTVLLPQLAYMAMGTCMHLSVGPFALISMLSADAIQTVVPDPLADPTAAVEASAVLALIVGLLLLCFGVLRLGFLATLLSDACLSGFCTASALLIPASQLHFAFQLTVPRGNFMHTCAAVTKEVIKGNTNLVAALIFFMSLITIVVIQKINQSPPQRLASTLKRFPLPAELIVAIASTVASYALSLEDCPGPCIKVLGKVPAGLPGFHFPDVTRFDLGKLMPSAFLVALMTYIISMSISKVFGRRFGYNIDSNQELLALGFANVAGCISSGYPAAASLSRTAIVASSGAATPLHGLTTAGVVALVLLFCVDLVKPLPLAALAAIVVMAFKSLLLNGIEDCRFSYRVSLSAFLVWQVAFWGTLAGSVSIGIVAAVLSDLLKLFYKTTLPNHSVLGRLCNFPTQYECLSNFSEAEAVPGVLIFRLNGPLHFANRETFISSIWREMLQREAFSVEGASSERPLVRDQSPSVDASIKRWLSRQVSFSTEVPLHRRLRAVVLDFSPVAHMDMSACRVLDRLRRELSTRGTQLVIGHCNYMCYKRMERMEVVLPFENSGRFDVVCFTELHDAVLFAEGKLDGTQMASLKMALSTSCVPQRGFGGA